MGGVGRMDGDTIEWDWIEVEDNEQYCSGHGPIALLVF